MNALLVAGQVFLAIVAFDIVVVLGLVVLLRLRRDELVAAPYRPLEERWLRGALRHAHRHRLPLQDGWSRDETTRWAQAGRDFPERLFARRHILVSFSPDELCPVCAGRRRHLDTHQGAGTSVDLRQLALDDDASTRSSNADRSAVSPSD